MPSKRHGAQTRKQWLRMKLELARDNAGGFWVERLLRSLGPSYSEQGYGWPALVDTFAAYPNLDAIARIPTLPNHWTDEQRRQYLKHGYVVEIGETTPEDRAQRKSPPVTVVFDAAPKWWQDAIANTMSQAERDGLVQRVDDLDIEIP